MESGRIKLVPPSTDVAPKIFEAIVESQIALSEFLPWVPYALTLETAVSNTQEAIKNFKDFNNELRFSIVCQETNALLGVIGLMIIDKSVPYFEIGYWLRTSQVGKGYASEAVRLLQQYTFRELGAQRIEIKMAESNRKSRAVAERCGYVYEGKLHNARRLPSGKLDNTLIYAKTGL